MCFSHSYHINVHYGRISTSFNLINHISKISFQRFFMRQQSQGFLLLLLLLLFFLWDEKTLQRIVDSRLSRFSLVNYMLRKNEKLSNRNFTWWFIISFLRVFYWPNLKCHLTLKRVQKSYIGVKTSFSAGAIMFQIRKSYYSIKKSLLIVVLSHNISTMQKYERKKVCFENYSN